MRPVFIFLVVSLGQVRGLNRSTINYIATDLQQQAPRDEPTLKHWLGGLVRLVFHDTGSYNPPAYNRGSCGCLNWADAGNGGLRRVVDGVENVYQKHKASISRADFWVLSGITAVSMAGGPQVPFRWGRQDCNGTLEDLPPVGGLPSAESNWTTIASTFQSRYGLSTQDTEALMGAHTLGGAVSSESGYTFDSTDTPTLFNNDYYRQLINRGWRQVALQTPDSPVGPVVQWIQDPPPATAAAAPVTTPPPLFPGAATPIQPAGPPPPTVLQMGVPQLRMFNTDMALRYGNIGLSATGDCHTTATYQTKCQENGDTMDFVRLYATDQQSWFTDFAAAYHKLTEVGYSGSSGGGRHSSTGSAGALYAVEDEPVETVTVST